MLRVLSILFGAAFTVATCWSCGRLLLRRLRIAFDPLETAIFSFLSGAACVSVLVFALCLIHQARAATFLGMGVGLIGLAVRGGAGKPRPYARVPRPWLLLFVLILALYFVVYFFNALAPEVSPDGAGYHLGNVARYWRNHGFVWDYRSMYSCFPQGVEMLFLVAFAFGRHSSAALVHFTFFLSLPLLMFCYGRRFELPRAGMFAAGVIFASPVFGVTGTSAYNDLALVTGTFAVFYLLEVIDDDYSNNILIILGILSGYTFSVKYTGGLALLYCAGWLLLRKRRSLLVFVASALVISGPWLFRNVLWIGNPVAPLFNRWFPNPYFSVSQERSYLADIAHFGSYHHWWELPLDLTLFGAHIPGFLGPVFLLAPLAVLAVREQRGRRLLLAAVLFSIPTAFNAATRFLMPGMPFLALALGLAMRNSQGVLPLLAVFQGLLCLPAATPSYAADWSWRVRAVPVRAALRLEPELNYLERHFPELAIQPTIEATVPKSQKIFSFATRPEAYYERRIIVGYESAEGLKAQGLLLGAFKHSKKPLELKESGMGFLLINRQDPVPNDLKQNSMRYGLSLVAEADGTQFYRID